MSQAVIEETARLVIGLIRRVRADPHQRVVGDPSDPAVHLDGPVVDADRQAISKLRLPYETNRPVFRFLGFEAFWRHGGIRALKLKAPLKVFVKA